MDFQKKLISKSKLSLKSADKYLEKAKRKLWNNISSLGNVITDVLGNDGKEFRKAFERKKNHITSCVVYFFISMLMGFIILYGNTFPFGVSFLCAFIGSKYSLYCISGALISAAFSGHAQLIRLTAYILLYSIRKVFSSSKFNEKPVFRITLAACFSLFIEISSVAGKYITFSNIFNITTCCLLSASAVYLFYIFCKGNEQKDVTNLYTLSLYAVFACTVSAFSRFTPLGINAGVIYAGIGVLYFSKSKGPIFGCVAGFIFGFSCSNPLYSAPLGIGGLICGYLFTKSFLISTLAFSFCSSLCALYLFGFDMLSNYFPFAITSSLLFLLIGNNLSPYCISEKAENEAVTSENTTYTGKCFNKVSDSLSGLSSILYKFAEHMKSPSQAETGDIFDNAFCDICSKCSMNTMCYAKRESNFPKVRDEVCDILRSSTLKEDELSKLLLHKCIRSTDLCDYINRHYSELRFLTAKSNRTGTVACLYNSMSRLIKETEKEDVSQNVRDSRIEKIISESLKKIGVEFSHVICKGSRTKDICVHGIKADKIPCSAKDLSLYLSKQCRISLSVPSFDISNSADMVMKLTRREIIGCEYAQCSNSKDGEDVNGDTASFFDSDDTGFFYSVIADGMGSGKTAAATSRLSCVFLEKLLRAGTKKSVCLELLNNLLLSKNDETFSSVDLLEIDKLNSSACFIKSGAAPSYILRGMKLYKIQSKTPPVGIIHSFSAESTSFSLNKGDVIIMLSDGVIGTLGDERWLSELIRLDTKDEPALLSSILIERAKKLSGDKDDMTACVIKII